MKNSIIIIIAILLPAILLGLEYVPNEIIVKTTDVKTIERGKLNLTEFDNYLSSRRMKSIKPVLPSSENRYFVIALEDDIELSEINSLDFEGIDYMQPNYINELLMEPNDPYFQNGDQWALNQDNDKDIDAPEAWDYTVGNREIIIGVVDSGMHFNHPDLKNNIFVNQGEIPVELYGAIDSNNDNFVSFVEILNYFSNENLELNEDDEVNYLDVLHANSPLINNEDNDYDRIFHIYLFYSL